MATLMSLVGGERAALPADARASQSRGFARRANDAHIGADVIDSGSRRTAAKQSAPLMQPPQRSAYAPAGAAPHSASSGAHEASAVRATSLRAASHADETLHSGPVTAQRSRERAKARSAKHAAQVAYDDLGPLPIRLTKRERAASLGLPSAAHGTASPAARSSRASGSAHARTSAQAERSYLLSYRDALLGKRQPFEMVEKPKDTSSRA